MLLLQKRLPNIYKPRKGKLEGIFRSQPHLHEFEEKFSSSKFNEFDIDKEGIIDIQELKSLLLQLNIMISDQLLSEYLEAVLMQEGSDGGEPPSSISISQF